MRSSGSTPSLPASPPVPLYVLLAGEDHPKECTGRRLVQRRLAREATPSRTGGRGGIVLDPYAPEPVAASDRGVAEAAGIVAIDCSWNRLGDRGRFPEGARIAGARRRLPILIATNPQHYGRVAQLNTVEALAAALRLVGHGEQARSILEGFRGAEQFLEVNRVRFDAYARAKDGSGIRAAERLLFGSDAPPVTPEAGSSGPRSRGARRARPRPR